MTPDASHRVATALGWSALLISLVVAVATIAWRLGSADLHPDTYNAMRMVDKDLASYVREFYYSPVIEVQFWLCDRMFGSSMAGYRLPGATAGILAVFALAYGMVRTWPNTAGYAAIVTLLFAASAHTQIYFRWGMATYGQNILLSVIILILFQRLAVRSPSRRESLLLIATLFAAPLVHFGLIIPIVAGASVALLLRLLFDVATGHQALRTLARDFAPMAALPVAFAAAWFVIRPWEWFSGNRQSATYAPFNFTTSGIEQNFAGLAEFAWQRADALLTDLLRMRTLVGPIEIAGGRIGIDAVLGIALPTLIALGAFVSLLRWRDRTRVFLVAYTAIAIFGNFLPSIWGLYRFGLPRYSMFLLPPLLLLAGLGLRDVMSLPGTLLERSATTWGQSAGRWLDVAAQGCLLALVLALGASFVAKLDARRRSERTRYDQVIEAVVQENREASADLVIMERTQGVWTGVLAPDLKKLSKVVPDWQRNQEPAPSPELTREILARRDELQRVMVIGRVRIDQDHYPSLLALFPENDFRRRKVACVYSRSCVLWLERKRALRPGTAQ